MDEMKIKLSTPITKSVVSKLIENSVYKKIGIRPSILINEIEADMTNGTINFHINADATMDERVILKIHRMISEEE